MSTSIIGIAEKINFKRHAVLHMVRRERSVGRLELARNLGISNSRVCDLVQQMLDEKLLIEDHPGNDRRGRRGVPVMVNPQYGHILGFDMEAKRLRLVVVDFTGEKVWSDQQAVGTATTRQRFVDAILDFIANRIKRIEGDFKNLLGIGLAVSGLADIRRGVILRHGLIPSATDIPLRDLVSDRIGLPCFMDDNIRALTLAEWHQGAAQQMESFVCLAVRTGVGTGIVVNGKIFTGSHGFAGKIANVPVPIGPSLAQWKTFEEFVSEHALDIDPDREQTEVTEKQAKRAGELLGAQLATIASFLDPQAIILSGDLVRPDGPLWDHAERAFRRLVLPELADLVQLRPARLGPLGAAIGATVLCFQNSYPLD
jgi:predicted NBD/HSP70 family sugar kinase